MSMDCGGNSLEADVRIMMPGKLAERSLDAASPSSPTLYLTPENATFCKTLNCNRPLGCLVKDEPFPEDKYSLRAPGATLGESFCHLSAQP